MKHNSNYTSVGIFVTAGILLFAFSVYFLSKDENIFSGRSRVYSYFDDTQGLMFGSIVSFSGITIGNVKSIQYDEAKEALKVEYTVKNSYLPFIKKDSTAQLKTQGALGDRFVFVSAGTPDSTSIAPGDEIPSSKGDDLFSAFQEKLNSIPDFQGMAKKIESLLDFLNSKDGLVGVSQELKTTLKEARSTIKDINSGNHTKESLKKLDSVLGKIDSGQGTLGRLITDPTLYNKLNSFISGGQNSSDYLKDMARKSLELSEQKK